MPQQSVRCPVCSGQVVVAGRPDADLRRCVRCQGRDRLLPVPHPRDHLCAACRSECPVCRAPAGPDGGVCRGCRRLCARCLTPLPDRSGEPPLVERPATGPAPSGGREPRTRLFVPDPRSRTLCDSCRGGNDVERPEQRVLRALPDGLIRACGGTAPAAAVEMIRAELQIRTAGQLVERIERRWHARWSHLPLRAVGDSGDRAGYGPDDVAVWLVAPGRCGGGCEQGWMLGTGDPCPRCRPAPRKQPAPVPLSPVAADMGATARDAIRRAKKSRPRGGYVPPPPVADRAAGETDQEARRRAGRPATRRREISPTEQRADPVRARAIERARLDRHGADPPSHPSTPPTPRTRESSGTSGNSEEP